MDQNLLKCNNSKLNKKLMTNILYVFNNTYTLIRTIFKTIFSPGRSMQRLFISKNAVDFLRFLKIPRCSR